MTLKDIETGAVGVIKLYISFLHCYSVAVSGASIM